MEHGKAICGVKGGSVVFEVKDYYAIVWDEGIRLVTYWAVILKHEPIWDVSLLDDSFVNEMRKKLSNANEGDKGVFDDRYDPGENNKVAKLLEELQKDALEKSRKLKKPYYI